MNHKQTIAIAKSKLNTDKESLFDSIIVVDFFNKVILTNDIQLIRQVHKVLGSKAVECVNHWQGDSLFEAFLDNKTLFPLEDPSKQVGDIVKFGKMVGVVKKIEGKIFIVHTTDGQDLPFIAEEDMIKQDQANQKDLKEQEQQDIKKMRKIREALWDIDHPKVKPKRT